MVWSSYASIWTFEILSPKRKTFKNSNEGTTIIFGSWTGHDLYFKSIKLSMNEVMGKPLILYNPWLAIKDLQTEPSCQ